MIYPEEELLNLNHIGLIPGPGESMEAFSKRAAYCQTLKDHLSAELKTTFDADPNDNPEILKESNTRLSALFDISPAWIPIFFSNYKLPFWQGGCAWIFQMTADSPTAALIQLRRTFQRATHYLGIYEREELLTHELAHTGRMAFNEPAFEEVFAYHSSHSSFRRWFGPILQSSVESVIFVLMIGAILVVDVFLAALHHTDAYLAALWLKLIPLGFIGYGVWRLSRKHRQLKLCLSSLEKCLDDPSKALAVAYRLSDAEIRAFSKLSSKEIKDYAAEQAKKELRWQVILKTYFLLTSESL